MELLDGKVVSRGLKDRIAAEVAELKAQGKRVPFLVAVLVGDDDAGLVRLLDQS